MNTYVDSIVLFTGSILGPKSMYEYVIRTDLRIHHLFPQERAKHSFVPDSSPYLLTILPILTFPLKLTLHTMTTTKTNILFAGFLLLCLITRVNGFGLKNPFATSPKTANSNKNSVIINEAKQAFLESLEEDESFNQATKPRTTLLNKMTTSNPTSQPGSLSSFLPLAPGIWRIVYAPHISTLSGLVGGSFDPVLYEMNSDQMIISHAKYTFPILGDGWLSVSGTYGTQDDDKVCRVNFDRAWIGIGTENKISSYDKAPDTWYKNIINSLGQLGFRKEFAVFPVSYLDEDTIVFDFELFGTRICARKISKQ